MDINPFFQENIMRDGNADREETENSNLTREPPKIHPK
jgi:hypothetical protein